MLMAISSRTIDFGDPITKEAYLFSRNLFLKSPSFDSKNKGNRFYVQRGNTKRRKVINEPQVISLLRKYGFEPIEMDNKTVQQQAELFSQAEAIVAPHGAALTNLLFVQAGVKVIELIPYGYTNNCFYAMASHGAAEYFYLQGEKANQGNSDIRCLDLYIDIQKLDEICKKASLVKLETVSQQN
jgi:capsular polysaccharide biosynthesis protein